MKRVAAAAALLLFAHAAPTPAFTEATGGPKLVVAGTREGTARVGFVVGSGEGAMANATIYVPAGYRVGTPAPGTMIGGATATAASADLGGGVLPLTGEVDAVAPTATTTGVAQACGVTPTQTWDLHLSASGLTLDLPVFVVTTVGAEQAAGFGTKLVLCLPPPDLPVGTPGRAVLGTKLLSATFASSAIALPARAGEYRWTSLWTPYVPGTGEADAPNTVETQALQRLPVTLAAATVRRRVVVGRTVTVDGRRTKAKLVVTVVGFAATVTEDGKPAARATIEANVGRTRLGGAKGSFLIAGPRSARLNLRAAYDSDSGSVPSGTTASPADLAFHDLGAGACMRSAIAQDVPCADATLGGGRIAQTVVVKAYTK